MGVRKKLLHPDSILGDDSKSRRINFVVMCAASPRAMAIGAYLMADALQFTGETRVMYQDAGCCK